MKCLARRTGVYVLSWTGIWKQLFVTFLSTVPTYTWNGNNKTYSGSMKGLGMTVYHTNCYAVIVNRLKGRSKEEYLGSVISTTTKWIIPLFCYTLKLPIPYSNDYSHTMAFELVPHPLPFSMSCSTFNLSKKNFFVSFGFEFVVFRVSLHTMGRQSLPWRVRIALPLPLTDVLAFRPKLWAWSLTRYLKWDQISSSVSQVLLQMYRQCKY